MRIIKQALIFSVVVLILGCSKTNPTEQSSPSQKFVASYKPPYFTDSLRKEKVKIAFGAIDKIFQEHAAKNHFPGIAYGIVVDNELVYSNASGLANIDSKTLASTTTNFRIASMSKSFTALSILKLRDEGKLSLTDPVSKFIPEIASVEYLTHDSPALTIENLLTMSAGFPEDNPWGDRQLADTNEDLINLVKQGISFANVPSLHYEYSNLGFALLGNIITKVSGQPYQKYITENILKPLQMNEAKWEFTEVPKDKLALGYRWENEQWKEEPILHDGSYGAMGGLICSVEDFSKYLIFHLSAWPARNDEESPIVKRSSMRAMHQLHKLGSLQTKNKSINGQPCPAVTGYGYGLGYRMDCNGIVTVRHGGGLPGYGSEWRFYPEYGIGVVSLSNLTYGGLGTTNSRALDTLIQLAQLKPRAIPASDILLQRQKEIVQVLQNWSAEKQTIFAENFFLDQSLESWKEFSSKLFSEAGKVVRVSTITPENQLRGTFIIEGEKKDIEVFFTLTPEHSPLVQQLDLRVIEKE